MLELLPKYLYNISLLGFLFHLPFKFDERKGPLNIKLLSLECRRSGRENKLWLDLICLIRCWTGHVWAVMGCGPIFYGPVIQFFFFYCRRMLIVNFSLSFFQIQRRRCRLAMWPSHGLMNVPYRSSGSNRWRNN